MTPPGTAATKVAGVVVSYNTRDDLLRCLRSLEAATLPLELLVVDNASSDGSAEAARREFPHAVVVANAENRGFAAACNQGWRASSAPYVLFLNSDAEVSPGAVEALAGFLDARPDVGIVGPRTVGEDGRIQVSTGEDLTPVAEWRQRRLVRGVRAGHGPAVREAEARHAREHEPFWVSASCLLARRPALDAVAGFDEAFFLYEEDVDLCARVRAAGWRVAFTPAATIRHRLGQSMAKAADRSRLEYHRSHLLYYRKHHGAFLIAALRLALAARGAVLWPLRRERPLAGALLGLAGRGR